MRKGRVGEEKATGGLVGSARGNEPCLWAEDFTSYVNSFFFFLEVLYVLCSSFGREFRFISSGFR